MSKHFDYAFGLAELVPSKQDLREGMKVSAFRIVVDKTITPEILRIKEFPSKREIFVAVMQFFSSKHEYESRDVDNMGKTVLDCLKGKLYVDDMQVRTLLVTKKMSARVPSNFVFVGIRELKGETDIEPVKLLMEQAITFYNQRRARQ